MDDLPQDANSNTPSTPGWVKGFGIIALVLILLLVILKFTGIGGAHGPGRHAPPSIVTEDSAQQP